MKNPEKQFLIIVLSLLCFKCENQKNNFNSISEPLNNKHQEIGTHFLKEDPIQNEFYNLIGKIRMTSDNITDFKSSQNPMEYGVNHDHNLLQMAISYSVIGTYSFFSLLQKVRYISDFKTSLLFIFMASVILSTLSIWTTHFLSLVAMNLSNGTKLYIDLRYTVASLVVGIILNTLGFYITFTPFLNRVIKNYLKSSQINKVQPLDQNGHDKNKIKNTTNRGSISISDLTCRNPKSSEKNQPVNEDSPMKSYETGRVLKPSEMIEFVNDDNPVKITRDIEFEIKTTKLKSFDSKDVKDEAGDESPIKISRQDKFELNTKNFKQFETAEYGKDNYGYRRRTRNNKENNPELTDLKSLHTLEFTKKNSEISINDIEMKQDENKLYFPSLNSQSNINFSVSAITLTNKNLINTKNSSAKYENSSFKNQAENIDDEYVHYCDFFMATKFQKSDYVSIILGGIILCPSVICLHVVGMLAIRFEGGEVTFDVPAQIVISIFGAFGCIIINIGFFYKDSVLITTILSFVISAAVFLIHFLSVHFTYFIQSNESKLLSEDSNLVEMANASKVLFAVGSVITLVFKEISNYYLNRSFLLVKVIENYVKNELYYEEVTKFLHSYNKIKNKPKPQLEKSSLKLPLLKRLLFCFNKKEKLQFKGETLYEKVGMEDSIVALLDKYNRKVLKDEHLNHIFFKTDIKKLAYHQKHFFIHALGGPNNYTGEDLKKIHKRFNLKNIHFDHSKMHIENSLRELNINETLISKISDTVETLRTTIVNNDNEK